MDREEGLGRRGRRRESWWEERKTVKKLSREEGGVMKGYRTEERNKGVLELSG